MKLGPVTKLYKRNKTIPNIYIYIYIYINDDVMSANGKVIANFPIYGQFGAIHKPDSDALSVKLTSSLKVTFYLTETKKKN